MAAQYLEFHKLKNENSPLKPKMNIYTIHKSTSFNLTISELSNFVPVNFSPLPSFKEKTEWMYDITTVCVCVCVCAHLCACVCEPQ
jgi:hypothetical protein